MLVRRYLHLRSDMSVRGRSVRVLQTVRTATGYVRHRPCERTLSLGRHFSCAKYFYISSFSAYSTSTVDTNTNVCKIIGERPGT